MCKISTLKDKLMTFGLKILYNRISNNEPIGIDLVGTRSL